MLIDLNTLAAPLTLLILVLERKIKIQICRSHFFYGQFRLGEGDCTLPQNRYNKIHCKEEPYRFGD